MSGRANRGSGWVRWCVAGMVAAALVVAATMAACGGDDDDNGGPTPTDDPTISTTQSEEAEVEAAYLAFADMGARLLQDPNPEDPEIPERTSGEAQSDLIQGLTDLQTAGHHYELGAEYSHDVLEVTVDEDSAIAEVCVVDDVRLVDSASGESLGEGITTARWTVALVQARRAWLIDGVDEREIGEGALECV